MSHAELLEFVARLTYNIDGLPRTLRLYFSQFLTFHFSKFLSINQIENIENARASLKFRDQTEMLDFASKLTPKEQCWAVASLQLLQVEADRIDNLVMSRRIGKLKDDLIRILSLGESETVIQTELSAIQSELQQFQDRPVIQIPARIWPMVLDFILRCASLILFGLGLINKPALIVGLNIFLIPILTVLIIVASARRNRRANYKLLETHGGVELYRIEYSASAAQYTWLAFFLVIGTFIGWLLEFQVEVITFIGLALYYFMYLRFFNLGRIRENELFKQLNNQTQRINTLDADENDEMIVGLETKLNASTSRLDAYVLESALFGALSFSGFLQIMASDLISFVALENFASSIFVTSKALIHFQWTEFWSGAAQLNSKVNLLCLVSVESLLCSIFFLAVIASRLRFSDIADNVRTAINMARAFNEKEEALYHESERNEIRQSRLQELTAKVNGQLFAAHHLLQGIRPVMAYMEYFRSGGILVFLVILISSSLFITGALGWTFLGLVVATYIYFNRDSVNLNLKAGFLKFRIIFHGRSYLFLLLSLSPFIVAIVLRNSFYWTDTGAFMGLGYALVGLFLFCWVLLGSHYDEEFGDIESRKKLIRVSRWNAVKYSLAAGLLLFGIGMAFKQLYLAGADEMVMLALILITLLMYFAGYYLNKVRWFGLVSGSFMGTTTVGILFRTLHLPGAVEMMNIGMFALIILVIVGFWKSRLFHSLFIKLCAGLLFITFATVSGLFLQLELAYAHRTTDLDPILKVLGDGGEFVETDKGAELTLASTDEYISRYGGKVPYPAVYNELVRMYNSYGEKSLRWAQAGTPPDSSILRNAAQLINRRDHILELYQFPEHYVKRLNMGLESDLLLTLGRQQDAIASLKLLIKKLPDPKQQERLSAKLAALTESIDVQIKD